MRTFEESTEDEDYPDMLLGPWEIKTSLSGFADTWVELDEGGKLSCSPKVGRGRRWRARRVGKDEGKDDGGASLLEMGEFGSAAQFQYFGWKLQLILLDKLDRPLVLDGEVRKDEFRGLVVSGDIRGAPKLGGSTNKAPVLIGEFSGFKLL